MSETDNAEILRIIRASQLQTAPGTPDPAFDEGEQVKVVDIFVNGCAQQNDDTSYAVPSLRSRFETAFGGAENLPESLSDCLKAIEGSAATLKREIARLGGEGE